jgi:glycosyltransferase involved in cell wall biosynthesis
MKVSILLEAFQPEYWGGRETRWAKLIAELSSRHQLTIFADFSRTPPEVAFPDLKIDFVHIGQLPNMYTQRGSRSFKHALLYSLRARKLLNYHSDVILTDQTPLVFMPLIWLYSKLNKSKFSVVWHEFWDYQTWSQYSKILAPAGVFIQNYAFLFSENIVVPSENVRKQIIRVKPRKKIRVIQNGFEHSHLPELPHTSEIQNDLGHVQLLYVGRLIKHKNVEFLILLMEAAKSLNYSWQLTIIGKGPIEESLKHLVQTKKLDQFVSFKKDVEIAELEQTYMNSSIFLFPSEREGFGISVAEALMHNLPIVVFDTYSNASADLITDPVLGRKIKQLDIKMWIEAISKLSHSKSHLISQTFLSNQKSWAQVAKEYELFLVNLAAKHE